MTTDLSHLDFEPSTACDCPDCPAPAMRLVIMPHEHQGGESRAVCLEHARMAADATVRHRELVELHRATGQALRCSTCLEPLVVPTDVFQELTITEEDK